MRKFILVAIIGFLMSGCRTKEKNADKANSSSNEIKSGYAPVNGLRMYYEMQGSGPPLVLIHGGGSTISTTFGKIIPFLSPWYRVIAVERYL